MAHYIAEVISDAKRAGDPKTKRARETAAAELIERLWAHRASYENRINPLHDLKPILQVLKSLDPNEQLWITNYGGSSGTAFKHVYEALRSIVIMMLFEKADAVRKDKSITSEHQSAEEREIVSVLDQWLAEREREPLAKADTPKPKSKKAKPSEPEHSYGDIGPTSPMHEKDWIALSRSC